MKKSNLLIAALFLAVCFSSCKKEEIQIVNQPQSALDTPTLRSSSSEDTPINCGGGVTDPNDDTDKDLDKKNPVAGGK